MGDARKAEDALAEKWVKEQAARIHAVSATDIRAVADLVYWSHVQGQRDALDEREMDGMYADMALIEQRDRLEAENALLRAVADAARALFPRGKTVSDEYEIALYDALTALYRAEKGRGDG